VIETIRFVAAGGKQPECELSVVALDSQFSED